MSETGKLGLEYWQVGSVQPQVSVNDALRILDTIGSNTVISRSTAAQPVSPDPGDAYILPSTPTGDDWGDWDEGDIAVYVSGSTPLQPAGWTRILPLTGVPFIVQDSGELVYWDGAAYEIFASGGGNSERETIAITDATDDLEQSWTANYVRFTHSAGAKTLTVRENATHAVAVDSEFVGRNAAANNLTIVAAGAVVINADAGGTLVVPPGGTFTLKCIATDNYDLFGNTVPA